MMTPSFPRSYTQTKSNNNGCVSVFVPLLDRMHCSTALVYPYKFPLTTSEGNLHDSSSFAVVISNNKVILSIDGNYLAMMDCNDT